MNLDNFLLKEQLGIDFVDDNDLNEENPTTPQNPMNKVNQAATPTPNTTQQISDEERKEQENRQKARAVAGALNDMRTPPNSDDLFRRFANAIGQNRLSDIIFQELKKDPEAIKKSMQYSAAIYNAMKNAIQ